MVKSGTGWRLRNDDGSKVEKVVNSVDNTDNDREAWKVTTLDGTQYYFGQHQLPGHAATSVTNSVWTAPVAGDDVNEQCHGTTFATSFCDKQAWRWNLDYVVDPDGNAMSFWYAKETNYYAKNGATTATKDYVRGGYLTKIQYGQRFDTLASATAPMQVLFSTLERCLSSCDSLTSTTKANWPDVPFDQVCAAGATCTKLSPTFFSRRRLEQVTTQVLKGTAYQSVDHWKLEHDFPNPGENMSGRALWLQSITHTGKAAGGAADPLKVTFGSIAMANRVDALDGISPMTKLRLRTIWTETGARITISYADKQCVAGVTMPVSPDSNNLRCFPVKWAPPNEAERDDWFHRYVVERVSVNDTTGGLPVVTTYTYSGGAAWHYQDDALTPAKDRNWSEWRGYRTVITSSGDPAEPGPRSKTVATYFRGMDGDKLKDGGTKDVSVPDSQGGSRPDSPALVGVVREAITYTGAGSTDEVSGSLTDYWVHETAAQTVEPNLVRRADFVKPSSTTTRIARPNLPDLLRIARTEFDPTTGLPIKSVDEGDSTDTADDVCSVTSYAQNTAAWLMSFTSRVVTSAGKCDAESANPPQSRVITDSRTLYDNKAFGAAPTKGQVSSTQRLSGYGATGVAEYQTVSTTSYDMLGRPTSAKDALGRETATVYTPAGAGALTQTVSKTPAIVAADGVSKSLVTTTSYSPEWGSIGHVVDPNGKVTDLAYDALGRLTSVWLPNQSKSAGKIPNTKYTYKLSTTAASYVLTESMNITANDYVRGYALYDSLLRPRQTQAPAVTSGRVITETKYDTRGLAVTKNADVWDSNAPSGTLANVFDASSPATTTTTFDGAGRETLSTFAVYGQPKWSTTTRYSGDTVTVLPPNGAPAKAEVKDGRGRVIERREYDGSTPTPGFIKSTYTYDVAGQLTEMASAGATWTYGYDLLGRKRTTTDPDAGTTTYGYDAVDRITSVTSANQKTLLTTYDNLDRKVAVHEGAKTDAQLRADWIYDVAGNLGQLYQSTRYTAGKSGPAYKSKTVARNVLYKPTATSVVIPSAEGSELDGTYQTNIGYAPDAETVSFAANPGGGGLGLETLNYTYNALGQPVSMTSSDAIYVKDLAYSPLGDPERYDLGSNGDMYILNYYEDGTRRLKQTIAGDVKYVANHNYTYDAAGNLLRDHNIVGQDTQCFDYDAHRRLAAAWTPAAGDCAGAPSTGVLGGPAPYWQSWTYTASGLRKTQTDHTSGGNTTATYTYDAEQPHTVKSIATTGASPKPTASYGYDASGQTVARPGAVAGDEQTLNWNAEGRLQKLTGTKTGETSYVYDADGGVLLRKNPGKTTLFVGPLELVLDTATRAVTAKRQYSIDGQPVAVRSSATDRKWLVPDYHGTTHVEVDSATLATSTRYSTPFGEARGAEPTTWPDERGFLGKPKDKTTGLTSVGARQYDPAIGRFISVDPMMDTADPQQMLGYTYANNNPTSMSDPTGLMNECLACGGGGGGGETSGGDTNTGNTNTGNTNTGNTNTGETGGTNGNNNDSGGGNDDNGGGNWFKKAVRKTSKGLNKAGNIYRDFQAGVGSQALDTAKGLGLMAVEGLRCQTTLQCGYSINIARTVIRDPMSLWDATVDPIKQDWSSGNRAGSLGRGSFMAVEVVVGTKGVSRAASSAAAVSRASKTAGTAAHMDSLLASGATVRHSATATAIGDDAKTLTNFSRSRGAGGRHDVIVHGTQAGEPIVNGRVTHPQQIATAILENPSYRSGCAITLVMCHGGRGTAAELSRALGVDVYATTRLAQLSSNTGRLMQGGN